MAPDTSDPRRPVARGPLWGHLTTMLVLLLVLGLLTFSPPPTSPPAIAEIAPAAVEQIKQAPVEQAVDTGGPKGSLGTRGSAGSGRGPSARPSVPPLPSVAPLAPEVPSPFTCVGKLPRQIEDPQSPPCVPFFQGDNGGATYQGVTRDSITVVVPDAPDGYNVLKAYEGFFNRRFQFYGRKLRLVGLQAQQQTGTDEAAVQQDLAAKADDEYKAFASLSMYAFQGGTYYRELARRRVISVDDYAQFPEATLRANAPYMWQYGMGLDRIMETTGSWICKRFAGRTADYTVDPALIGRPRKLGLIYQDTSGNRFKPDEVQRAAKSCGAPFVTVKHLEQNVQRGTNSTGAEYQQDPVVQNAVLSMRNSGVTTVLCLCDVTVLGAVSQYASSQTYSPEWLTATYNHHELLISQRINNPSEGQREGLLGLSFLPRLLRAADDPSIWALKEQDPSVFVSGRDDESALRQATYHKLYRPLLLLASGIQLAGPRLTPETFAAGLHRTRFPNPVSPLQPGTVGFEGGSFSMTKDAVEMWWSNSALSPYEREPAPGTWCYVADGARRRAGDWPGQPAFKAGVCDSGR